MKKILKYSAALAMIALGFASCEQLPDYQTTIDAAQDLIYVNPQGGDTFSTLVVHRPDGSTGSCTAEFQVNLNSTSHNGATVTVAYAPELVSEYNSKHGTKYVVLSKEYFTLENEVLTVEPAATVSKDTVRIKLNEQADLAQLTERAYLAPFTMTSNDAQVSESLGNVWFVVNTETNIIAPLASADALKGIPAGGTVLWTADCANDANLFDGNTSTTVSFSSSATNELVIDMKKENMVTGLKLNTYNLSGVSIEYSKDGETWNQAGSPASGEYVFTGSSSAVGNWCVALVEPVTARYVKLSFKMANSRYLTMTGVEVYVSEGPAPAVYTITGADNHVTGAITHKAGAATTSSFSASFAARLSEVATSDYTVTAVCDEALVAAYNQKYGTSYNALPAEYLAVSPATVSIPAGETVSAEQLTLALTGDMTALTEGTYLAAVKLFSAGAATSENKGVVYAVITPEKNIIKDLNSASDVVGFKAGRTGWTATSNLSSPNNLLDGSTSTRINCNQTGNVVTVNMGGVHTVSALEFTGYPVKNIQVEYSTDGSTWASAGTVADSELVFTGSNANSQGYTYIGFTELFEASNLRLTFNCPNSSSSRRRVTEFNVYELDGVDPAVYTVAGTDNMFTGAITHHVIAGTFGSASATFTPNVTHASETGYDVVALIDNSYVASYNAANGTSYAEINAANVEITGMITRIEAGATTATSAVTVALKGDLSKLTNKNGYLIPVKLVTSGAVTSAKRGVVYIAVSVAESDAKFMTNFTNAAITGTLVADRSGWSIVACDSEGVHSGSYEELFDDNTASYIRTWGGPVSFTIDLGQEVEMTGLQITARTDNNTYASYQPNSIQIMSSLNGESYTDMGTVAYSEGSIYRTTPTSYVALYVPEKVRFLKIEASYGSNMGAGDFNIYVK